MLPVLTNMSSRMMFVLSTILLGQIYINSGENSKIQKKGQIQLLPNAVYRKYQEKTNSTQNNSTLPRNCVFRVENGDHLVFVNKTKVEIEKEGLTIYDDVCEGDLGPNGDRISSGALASLCCG